MNPAIADIWEWTTERWCEDAGDYVTYIITILILTQPEKDRDHWRFKGLELDGPESGTVEYWSIWDDPFTSWRQVA